MICGRWQCISTCITHKHIMCTETIGCQASRYNMNMVKTSTSFWQSHVFVLLVVCGDHSFSIKYACKSLYLRLHRRVSPWIYGIQTPCIDFFNHCPRMTASQSFQQSFALRSSYPTSSGHCSFICLLHWSFPAFRVVCCQSSGESFVGFIANVSTWQKAHGCAG